MKLVNRISQWVDNVFNLVAYETNAHVFWNELQEMCERKIT